ncbi:MAG: S8 family serine peptidase [Bacteroidales bacterium]|nr:S8 family serine peptidase [Bacteroidales bacterium]
MKRVLSLLPLLLCLCCARENPEPAGPVPSPYISGEIIAEFSDALCQAASDEFNYAMASIGATSVERLYPDAGEWEPRHRAAGLHRWFRITYDSRYASPTKAAGDLLDMPGVLYAGPVRRVRRASFFNDPYAYKQWSLYNDGSEGEGFLSGCDINVQKVWSDFTAGSPDVIVAVIDEGVQLGHEDLAASAIPAGYGGSYCFVYGNEGEVITPGHHGTHVAGIIGAASNNGIGVSGIAGGNDGSGGVRLLCCEVFRDNPDDKEHMIQGNLPSALVWAADHGAVIANNSWGYVYESEEEALAGDVGAMRSAIDYFINYAGCDAGGKQRPDSPMKGGLVVFAAGNDGFSMGWPAAYEPVVAVGAVSARGERAPYSNYGDWVDICAPGGVRDEGSMILSTVDTDGYGYFQGTSMACPHVVGVAALLVSYYGGQGFTCDMLKKKLLDGASRDRLPGGIGPVLDAYGSFKSGGTIPPEPVSEFEVSANSNFVTCKWSVTADEDDGKAFSFHLLASKDRKALLDADLSRGVPAGIIHTQVETGVIPAGGGIRGVLSGLDFNTLYYVGIVAADYNKNYSAISPLKEIVTGTNRPPLLSSVDGTRFSLKSHETLTCHFYCSDPDGHKVLLEYEPGSDAFTASIDKGIITAVIRGADAPSGKYTAVVTATDGFGGRVSCRVVYEILPNHAPVTVGQMENHQLSQLGSSLSVNAPDFFFDEDGEELEYSMEIGNEKVLDQSSNGGTFFISPRDYGLSDVTLLARDVRGETAAMSFKVLVDDGSHPVRLYPNPVKTVLNVWTAAEGSYDVSITDRAGAPVHSSTLEIGPFSPVSIDLSDRPSGIYNVRISGGGSDGCYSIAKL